MQNSDNSIVQAARYMALVAALAISLGIPGIHFFFAYNYHDTVLKAQTSILAQPLQRMINLNPMIWTFDSEAIQDLLSRGIADQKVEVRRVKQLNGKLIESSPGLVSELAWPTITVRQQLMDQEQPVAELEVIYSLDSALSITKLVALMSTTAGFAIFWFLSQFPLRMLEKSWRRINYLASYDALTGLPNRPTFLEQLSRVIEDVECPSQTIIIHCIDLDHFKAVNDTLGHAAGDTLLRQAAERMRDCIRKGDTLARMGGDEFALIQTNEATPKDAATLAARLIATLSEPFELEGKTTFIGASIGMAIHSQNNPVAPDQLLKNADMAIYKSKSVRRGIYHFFHEDLDQELRARKQLESDLIVALREEQFVLHYQPQIDPSCGQMLGVEALLRWHHPERGLIPSNVFVSIAETMPLMSPLTRWIFRTACAAGKRWPELKIAVNVPPTMFERDDMVEMVNSALAETGLPPERLELEITEDVLLVNTGRTLTTLEQLKSLGIRLAMDDFGTGYSSLGYLRKFRFDKLKIDRSFVTNIDQDKDAITIVRAIVGMGKALGMTINAEGVETEREAETLMREGCDEVQGFLYSRPVPGNDIDELIAAEKNIVRLAPCKMSALRLVN